MSRRPARHQFCAPAAGILKRRQQFREQGLGGSQHYGPGQLEEFFRQQDARIERTLDAAMQRVRERRRTWAKKAIEREAPDLVVTVRGFCGSDAHVDDDDGDGLVRKPRTAKVW